MVPKVSFYPEIREFFPLRVCGECEHLTTKKRPELMAAGIGDCTGYDNSFRKPRDTTVSWDQRECSHFRRARDMEPRKQWMEKCNAREGNTENKTGTKE